MLSLRDLLRQRRCVMAPGVYDCLSAKSAEAAGFEAISISGYSFEAAHFGLPDLGFSGLTDIADAAARIKAAVNVPIICDADTGYGGPANVRKTVQRLEATGITAIHIEDQADPKKCGGLPGRTVIPAEAMIEKIKAALAARASRDFLVIARTDAKSSLGFEEAARRLNAYIDAGADVAFAAERYETDELIKLARMIKGPLAICGGVPGWPSSFATAEAFGEMGVKLVIYPFSSLYVAARAMQDGYVAMQKAGGLSSGFAGERMTRFDEFSRFIGVDTWS
jgi:2-methylisocitrate lyase-like PEP mutase family enzyme